MPKSCSLPVTLVIFTYNQQSFIADAINAALLQDYDNLRIIVSDDYSTDDTYEIMRRIVGAYEGPHSIICRRNQRNLGLIGHINTVMESVDTELVVVAAGDDISLPSRVSILYDAYQKHGKPKLLSSKAIKIDAEGTILDGLAPEYTIPTDNFDAILDSLNTLESRVGLYLGASGAWSMDLWNTYGPIRYANCWEDVVMGFRAAIEGSYYHIDEPLVKYRVDVGISNVVSGTLKGKVALRKKQILLRQDLAKQRLDDLSTSNRGIGQQAINKVAAQVSKHAITLSFYEPWRHVLKSFRRRPWLTTTQGVREGKFLLKAIGQVLLNNLKLKITYT